MTTQGIYGFVKNNKTLINSTRYDGYPSGLGLDVLKFIVMCPTLQFIYDFPDTLQIVNFNDLCNLVPNYPELTYNSYISSKKPEDFLNSNLKVITDDIQVLSDGIWAEYVYLINLDTHEFEFYKGFQKAVTENRYYNPDKEHHINMFAKEPIKTIWETRNIYTCKIFKGFV